MKKTKLRKLTLAIAAAGMIGAASVPALSYALEAGEAIQQIGAYIDANDIDSALALLDRLAALGITDIDLGSERVSLAQLREVITAGDPVAIRSVVARLADLAAAAPASAFLAGTRIVTAEAVTAQLGDVFPTGSAG